MLQAGTAVLVDGHGAPKVRCACGNPLKPPVAVKGAVVHTGQSWDGYRPDKVVVIKPTVQIINSLVIVNVINNTWIERNAGTDGEEDKRPDVLPPVTPDDIFTYPPLTEPPGAGDSTQPGDSTGPSDGTSSPAPPEQPVNPPVEPVPDMPNEQLPPPVEPDVPSEEGSLRPSRTCSCPPRNRRSRTPSRAEPIGPNRSKNPTNDGRVATWLIGQRVPCRFPTTGKPTRI